VSSPSLHLPTLLLNAGKVAKNSAYVDSSASNPGTYFVFLTALYVFRSQILFEEYMQCFSSVLACSICATRVVAIVFFNLWSMSANNWLEITIHVEVLSLFCGLPCFYRVEWFCIRSEGVCRRLGSSALDMRFPSTPSTPQLASYSRLQSTQFGRRFCLPNMNIRLNACWLTQECAVGDWSSLIFESMKEIVENDEERIGH
jgi:hypothetical protein